MLVLGVVGARFHSAVIGLVGTIKQQDATLYESLGRPSVGSAVAGPPIVFGAQLNEIKIASESNDFLSLALHEYLAARRWCAWIAPLTFLPLFFAPLL